MLEHMQPLIRKALVRSYAAGSTIVYQGEAPRSACIITKGIVRVFSISAQGDEQIVTFHIAGELFPSSWVFGKTPASLYFYEAVTDCDIALVPREEVHALIKTNTAFAQAMLDYYITAYTAALVRISALEQAKAREKLIFTLFYLCQRYGKSRGVRTNIELSLTHQSLAGLVGLTRETTATEIGKLKRQGVLAYEGQQYTVHTEKLLDLIGEDSFRGMSIR